MTLEDAIKSLGVLFIGGVLGYLGRLTVGSRDKVLVLENEQKRIDAKIGELERGQISTDRMREVIDASLARNDALVVARQAEQVKLLKAEFNSMVAEKLEIMFPRIVHELRGLTPEHGTRVQRKGDKD